MNHCQQFNQARLCIPERFLEPGSRGVGSRQCALTESPRMKKTIELKITAHVEYIGSTSSEQLRVSFQNWMGKHAQHESGTLQ